MLAVDLIQLLSQALFVVVFLLALPPAIRHPRPATIEIAVLFGAASLNVAESWVFQAVGVSPPRIATDVSTALVLAVPYLLLRLVDEFAGVSGWVQRLSEAGVVAAIVARFISPLPPPLWVTELQVLYFVLVTGYVTVAFVRAARHSLGVTFKRLIAVAIGCGCLVLAILLAGLRAAFPSFGIPFTVLGGPLGLAGGVAFYVGFTTPKLLLLSWREPDLRRFLARAEAVAEQTATAGMIRELQSAVGEAVGLPGAFVGLWDERENVLQYALARAPGLPTGDSQLVLENGILRTPPHLLVAGKCFSEQQPLYSEDVHSLDPDHASLYRALGIEAVIVSPMTIGEERFGVLGVYTPRPRLFGEGSLERVQLLARQAAIMLRTRKLLERAASVQAREELARLKEEFVSAATHDLKTPLTGIKGLAQLIRRRLAAADTVNRAGVDADVLRIEAAADRMASLIDELLDVSRLQMAQKLQLSPSDMDLMKVVHAIAERHQEMTSRHRIRVDGPVELRGQWDPTRLERALENLVGNAVKFSPDGGEVLIEVAIDEEQAVLAIRDGGIGIRADELERVFERFERGANAAELGIGGTGIGLAYVREVVRGHGGEVVVESKEGVGSVFTMRLPLHRAENASSGALRSPHGEVERG